MDQNKRRENEYYIHFCREYASTTGIPTSLREKELVIYSSQAEAMGIKPLSNPDSYLYYKEQNGLEFCAASEHIQYARIPVKNTDFDIYLGPVFPSGINDEIIRDLMREQVLSADNRKALVEYIMHIPEITSFQLARHMVLVNRCINQEVVDTNEIFGLKEDNVPESEHTEYNLLQEDDQVNKMYAYSTNLYEVIRKGNETELNSYLFTYSSGIRGGKLASSQLRQFKNQFIVAATEIVAYAAIPAGVSPREAIELSSRYIRECEATNIVSNIASLQYSMMKDFCRLCREAHVPRNLSGEAMICLNYIRNNINDNIGVSNVASAINRSESYTMKLFREELGVTIGAMVTRCKLEEAKSLLTHSNISLLEISSYLCFSSQSYFQNQFKKQYGITPAKYRKENKMM